MVRQASELLIVCGLSHRFLFIWVSPFRSSCLGLYSFACGVRGCDSGGMFGCYFYLVIFSYLVSCHIGLETWIPKGGQRVLSFTAKVIKGVCFISFSLVRFFARRGARSKGGFSWVRFFQVGVSWIGLGVLGMKNLHAYRYWIPWSSVFYSKAVSVFILLGLAFVMFILIHCGERHQSGSHQYSINDDNPAGAYCWTSTKASFSISFFPSPPFFFFFFWEGKGFHWVGVGYCN